MPLPAYPKIELHVHLEATVTPEVLLRVAKRNGADLRYQTVEELEAFYAGASSFEQFIACWIVTSRNLQTYDDFREIVVEYARMARDQGVVYAEAICSPTEPLLRGTPWEVMFEGYCDGCAEAAETFGVDVRLTPDASRDFPARLATTMAKWAVKYRDRGVVALSLGGTERKFPPEKFRRAFAVAREGGLGAAPHAGEFAGGKAGVPSIRAALDVLHADRLRHGIRAVDDAALLAELAERGVVCDVCPTSNVRLGAVPSMAEHPLPQMLARRRQVLDLDRRPRAARHRPAPRARDRDRARSFAAGDVRARPRRRALRARPARAPRPHRPGLRLGRRSGRAGAVRALPA